MGKEAEQRIIGHNACLAICKCVVNNNLSEPEIENLWFRITDPYDSETRRQSAWYLMEQNFSFMQGQIPKEVEKTRVGESSRNKFPHLEAMKKYFVDFVKKGDKVLWKSNFRMTTMNDRLDPPYLFPLTNPPVLALRVPRLQQRTLFGAPPPQQPPPQQPPQPALPNVIHTVPLPPPPPVLAITPLQQQPHAQIPARHAATWQLPLVAMHGKLEQGKLKLRSREMKKGIFERQIMH